MGLLALAVLGLVVTALPADTDGQEREPLDVVLLVFYASALAPAAILWLLVAAHGPQSPQWLSVLLVAVAVPALAAGVVVGILSILASPDPLKVFIIVPSILCVLTALVVLYRQFPRVSAVQDERFSSRCAGGNSHDAV